MSPIRLLTFTTLYPSSVNLRHGIFVEQRLRKLVATGEIEARVVAPVPWFPFRGKRFGHYAQFARTPLSETRHGLTVLHPRYLLLPRIGMTIAPFTMALSGLMAIRKMLKGGYSCDIIDAHYFYPDGVAAVLLAGQLRKPVVITARGTDLNLIPRYRLPRKMIQWAARRASAIVTVCAALKDVLVELGIPADRVVVLRNGVDLQLFEPVDRDACRKELGLSGTTLLSVGHLVERKGHDIAIKALPELPDARLLIVGDGEEETTLRRLAKSLGVADRVTFVGAVAQEQLKDYYGAADALILASSREGWANVLLEAMACGTPVIASDVWGTPEVVAAPEAGVLMDERSPEGLLKAYRKLFTAYPDRAATRRYAEQFSWDATVRGQKSLYAAVIGAANQV